MVTFVGKAARQWRMPGRHWRVLTPDYLLTIHRHASTEFYWYLWNRRDKDQQGWAASVRACEIDASRVATMWEDQ